MLTLELSAASERAAHHVAPATSPLPGVTCRDMHVVSCRVVSCRDVT